MGAFKAAGQVVQSADGKTLIYNDLSNYGDNDAGLEIADFASRIVVISDANTVVLGEIILGLAISGNLPITKDGYYSSLATLITSADVPQTFSDTVNVVLKQFYALAQVMYSKTLRHFGCCSPRAADLANDAMECAYSADNNLLIGDGIAAQTDMDKANIFINAALK